MGRRKKKTKIELAEEAYDKANKPVDNVPKWDDAFLFRINNLARAGKNYAQIAEDLGIHVETLSKWRRTKPLVRAAFKDADDYKSARPFIDSIALRCIR